MRLGVGFLVLLCIVLAAAYAWAGDDCAAGQAAAKTGLLPGETHPALRIYDLRDGAGLETLVSYESLLAELEAADVVFLGEQHDDPATHYTEWRILRDLTAAHGGVQALSMEMFERDVQSQLSAYLRGDLTEDEFLANSRPWPNYPTDYRPMVELAKAESLPVVAANIPRPLASRVAKQGLEPAQAGYTIQESCWVASDVSAPLGLYWELFYATMAAMMGGHSGDAAPAMPPAGMGSMSANAMPQLEFISNDAFLEPYTPGAPAFELVPKGGAIVAVLPDGLDPGAAMIYQIYQAQCIKDDTMAESIARQRQRDPMRPVLHINGSFHSDYVMGTYSRLQTRRSGDKLMSVTMRPVAPLSAGDPAAEQLEPEEFSCQPQIADFLIFVPAPETQEQPIVEPAKDKEAEEATAASMPVPAGV